MRRTVIIPAGPPPAITTVGDSTAPSRDSTAPIGSNAILHAATGTSAVQAVATHFRHGDVSNLDTSLGHKAILHNPNGERARRIARPRGERLDTGLSLDLHRRWPSPPMRIA